jgi:hypothetical protein
MPCEHSYAPPGLPAKVWIFLSYFFFVCTKFPPRTHALVRNFSFLRGCPPGKVVQEAEDSRDSFLEPGDLTRIANSNNAALVILHVAGEYVGRLLREGNIDTVSAASINHQLEVLTNTQVLLVLYLHHPRTYFCPPYNGLPLIYFVHRELLNELLARWFRFLTLCWFSA